MLLFVPDTYTVLMSIVDSTTRLAGSNETLQNILLGCAMVGLLVDVVFQSRPRRMRHEDLLNSERSERREDISNLLKKD